MLSVRDAKPKHRAGRLCCRSFATLWARSRRGPSRNTQDTSRQRREVGLFFRLKSMASFSAVIPIVELPNEKMPYFLTLNGFVLAFFIITDDA